MQFSCKRIQTRWSDFTLVFKNHVLSHKRAAVLLLQRPVAFSRQEFRGDRVVGCGIRGRKRLWVEMSFHASLPPCGLSEWWVTGPWTMGSYRVVWSSVTRKGLTNIPREAKKFDSQMLSVTPCSVFCSKMFCSHCSSGNITIKPQHLLFSDQRIKRSWFINKALENAGT